MAIGHGSLANLERLKEKYGPEFRAAAQKRRRITAKCFEASCPVATSRLRWSAGGLRVTKQGCYRKKCPKEKVEE